MSAPRRPLRSIWFDCDSTLSTIEGVDELLARVTEAERVEIKALTHKAMEGEIPLEDVYQERLARIAPTAEDLAGIATKYMENVTPGVADVVRALRALGKHVGVVSGGLQQPVERFAVACGFAQEDVHAVPVILDDRGRYVDFDRSGTMWRSGGKAEFFRALPKDLHPAAHIGDGATDLEARGILDRFLGFGGVVTRPIVQEGCDHFIAENHLAAALPYLLTDEEWDRMLTDPELAPALAARRPPH